VPDPNPGNPHLTDKLAGLPQREVAAWCDDRLRKVHGGRYDHLSDGDLYRLLADFRDGRPEIESWCPPEPTRASKRKPRSPGVTVEVADEMRRLHGKGVPFRLLAARFDVSETYARNIVSGKTKPRAGWGSARPASDDPVSRRVSESA
jgi:hypothetical protein